MGHVAVETDRGTWGPALVVEHRGRGLGVCLCHRRADRRLPGPGPTRWLCARCLGILAGGVAGAALMLAGLGLPPLWGLVLVAPLVVDWASQGLGRRESGNGLRLATGALFGLAVHAVVGAAVDGVAGASADPLLSVAAMGVLASAVAAMVAAATLAAASPLRDEAVRSDDTAAAAPVPLCIGAAGAAAGAALLIALIAILLIVAIVAVVAIVVAFFVLGWRWGRGTAAYREKRDALVASGDVALVHDHVRAGRGRGLTGGKAFDRLRAELADRGHELSGRELSRLVKKAERGELPRGPPAEVEGQAGPADAADPGPVGEAAEETEEKA